VKDIMAWKRSLGQLRLGLILGIFTIVLLFGVSSVGAEFMGPEALNFGEEPATYPSVSMFSPAPGYLAIQTLKWSYYENYPSLSYVYKVQTVNSGGHPQFQYLINQPLTVSGQIGNPCPAGFRSAYVNGVNYIFGYDFSTGQTSVDSFTVQPVGTGWSGSWGAKKTISNYAWDNAGSNPKLFQVCGSDNGVYLIRKVTSGSTPYLDVFFISIEDLEGSSSVLTAQPVYSLTNNDSSRPGFSPVPDTEIYDAMVTTHMYTDQPVIIWTYDFDDTVQTSFIGPDNYYGEKILIDQNTWTNTYKGKPSTVILTAGSYQENPSGVNNINAIVCGDVNLVSVPVMTTYTCDVSSFPTDSWVENPIKVPSTSINEAFGYGIMSKTSINVPIENSENSEVVNCLLGFQGKETSNIGVNAFWSYLALYNSDMLVRNTAVNTFDTQSDFNTYGNLAVPVGFVDGAPPFTYNGYECDGMEVTSEVELSKTDSQVTETGGSESAKATVSYENKFLKKRVGLDASASAMVEASDSNKAEFSQKTIDTISHCSMGEHSNGFILYLAPNLVTHAYNYADYNSVLNPGHPEILYLTTMSSTNPVSAHALGYNITSPPTSGPLAGMMTSPAFNNFNEWNWASWSGGWADRDWTQSPYASYFTATSLGNNLEWSMGVQQTTEFEMATETSNTQKVDGDVEASVKIMGFGAGGTFDYEDEKTITNAINQGIAFKWSMKEAEDDVCGYDTIQVEPVILTPNGKGKVPWVPDTFSGYQPWLLTYNLLSADKSSGCYNEQSSADQKIHANVIPAGAGTITLPEAGIRKGMFGQVKAVPAEGYRFLHWDAYGLDLNDSSSSIVNATVNTDLSTIRAIFAKKSSKVVDTAIIAVQNSSPGNLIKIQGKIPDEFTRNTALHLQKPLTVRVGDLAFPFGPTVGNRTIVSDHEITYTTSDSTNGVSHLTVDFGTGKWWFTANPVKTLVKYGLKSNIVNVGIGGKNLSITDDVLMTGKEDISWSGSNENATNDVFRLKNATLQGTIRYLDDNLENCFMNLRGGELTNATLNATKPLAINLNGIDILFSNATNVSGDIYTYEKYGNDLTATIQINTNSRKWDAVFQGKRLSQKYWGENILFGLQVGNTKALEVIHPLQTTYLRTPNLAVSSSDSIFSQMNFGA